MNNIFNTSDLGNNIKEGLYDKYLYKDGKKYIGQVKKNNVYQTVANFVRKSREEYISIFNTNKKKYLKNNSIKSDIPTDEFLLDSDYHPLGKNIDNNFRSVPINKLEINAINYYKYIILKIASGIYIDNETKFLGEDKNGDFVNISMNYVENYFHPKNFMELEKEVFKLGKYMIVIEPNYGIFENSDADEIKISSPSEIILFEDKSELDYFLEKNKDITPENYKLLGNLMIKNHFYEKAIYYYNSGIKINKNDDNLDVILHSNLSEAYIKFGYFTKSLQYVDYCLDKLSKILEDKNKEKDKFLYQLKMRILFRKIKALLALRKFKEAYDIFYNKSENNPNNDIMNEFMELKQVKELLAIVKNGYENTLGHYDYIKMLKEEENNFDFTNYGEYINPKIEIKSEKGRGIKLVAKEKINIGELLIAEKALAFSRGDCDSDNKEDIIVSKDNPKVIVEIELFNKLFLKLKKSPLDYEKFYLLYDGRNLEQDISERKKYLEEQDKGTRDIELFKINQAICLNKYGSGRYILMDRDIGAGLWGYASFFNHDCLPNTNHFGIGDFYFGYCIREIDKGEELTTKYVSSRRSYKERQQIILENWRFNCNCQLCKYQLKKNDTIYENYMEMMNKHSNEIPIKNAKLFEEYLEENKKKYSCYEMANAYLRLEEYYNVKKDFNAVKKFSELVTKYANGKNFLFQLENLYMQMLTVSASGSNEFLTIYKNIIKYLEKYTPLNNEEIQYLFRNQFCNH